MICVVCQAVRAPRAVGNGASKDSVKIQSSRRFRKREHVEGDRNGRKERLEATARKRKDGEKVELDCLLGRGQARGFK